MPYKYSGAPTLSDLLGQAQHLGTQLQQQRQFDSTQRHDTAQTQLKNDLQNQGALERFLKVKDASDNNPDIGYEMGADSASAKPAASVGMVDLRKEQNDQKMMEKYTKQLNQHNGFTSALKQLEGLTNTDGKGGVLTNPEAKQPGAEGWQNVVPTPVIGAVENTKLGNFLGVKPGSTELRKSNQRLQNEYYKAMTGMRQSEGSVAREKEAMGQLGTNDLELAKKAERSLAQNVKEAIRTTQAGYSPEVRERVHSQLGEDPLDFYNKVYIDPPIGTKPAQSIDDNNSRASDFGKTPSTPDQPRVPPAKSESATSTYSTPGVDQDAIAKEIHSRKQKRFKPVVR